MTTENITMKKNGNIIALIAIILTSIALLTSGVMAYGELNQKVENLNDNFNKDNSENIERVKNIETRILSVETKLAGTEVSIQAIKEDIGEIKIDVREIATSLREK